jgi:hypothetical protein
MCRVQSVHSGDGHTDAGADVTSNLKCCCGGDAQILKVHTDTARFVRELGVSGVTVLWVCLRCGNIEDSFATIQEIAENEKIYGVS